MPTKQEGNAPAVLSFGHMDIGDWPELNGMNRALEAAPLVPLACAWVRRYHVPAAFRPIYYFVGAKSLLYFLNIFSRQVLRNDVYLYHLATVVLVVLLAQAYRRILPESFHKLILAGVVGFGAVAVLDAGWLNGLFTDVNSYSQAAGCALLVLLAILHISHMTSGPAVHLLESKPEFFLSLAVLIYCSCSVVCYLSINMVYNTGDSIATMVQLDRIITSLDTLLMALQMGLLTRMFSFFPLNSSPLRALPYWLHYSQWQPRPYRFLGHSPDHKTGNPTRRWRSRPIQTEPPAVRQ